MKSSLHITAKKKVQKKKSFNIVATIFGSLSTILFVISLNFGNPASYWIKFPILILALILLIIYVSLFGISLGKFMNEDWEEEEIEKEMLRLSKDNRKALPSASEMLDMSESELLELKEIEILKKNRDRTDDFV